MRVNACLCEWMMGRWTNCRVWTNDGLATSELLTCKLGNGKCRIQSRYLPFWFSVCGNLMFTMRKDVVEFWFFPYSAHERLGHVHFHPTVADGCVMPRERWPCFMCVFLCPFGRVVLSVWEECQRKLTCKNATYIALTDLAWTKREVKLSIAFQSIPNNRQFTEFYVSSNLSHMMVIQD